VGNNGHYKNREGVLRIFSQIRKVRESRLVMAGAPLSPQMMRLVDELGLGECVDCVADVDDAALCELYRKASVLLFPSIYEGFGWPPLEAMACGCPVVCSSEASLPEVVGDAALMAPADDEGQLATLCLSVLTDTVLAESLIEKGRKHARQFTTERMGNQLVEMYEHVLDQQVSTA
jgi:glycosyltransferase involved in cell wall biosynthesis